MGRETPLDRPCLIGFRVEANELRVRMDLIGRSWICVFWFFWFGCFLVFWFFYLVFVFGFDFGLFFLAMRIPRFDAGSAMHTKCTVHARGWRRGV